MASAGWTPRCRRHVGHRRIGGQPALVDLDAFEVGRPGLGPDPGPAPVVGLDGRIDKGPPPLGIAQDAQLLLDGKRPEVVATTG